jgi:ribose transport system ATP-binding protein
MTSPILEIANVSKTFGGSRALSDVSLEVFAGEVLAVIGQNGSGKSTLIKILAGFHEPDPGGEIVAWGERITTTSARSAHRGLHFIHQDLALIDQLSTVENLGISRGLGRSALVPTRSREEGRRAQALLAEFGVSLDVHVPVGRLSRAEQTLVAIARALDAWTSTENVIVLDEPTAALHRDEAATLFAAIRHLASGGTGVIFVSHRLDEVVELADRVVGLRDGRVVGTLRRGEFDQDDLITLMTGSEVEAPVKSADRVTGETMLEVRGLTGPGLRDVDVAVRAREIVGVTGLVGSGREHLAGIVFGAEERAAGTVAVAGRTLPSGDPGAAIQAGVGFVPADRPRRGAVMTMSVEENVTLPHLTPLERAGRRLDSAASADEAKRWIGRVDVRPPDPSRVMTLLSGGNQQKVVMAKWLRMEPRVLLLDEPTQGVDVAAKATIHGLILGAVEAGAAVLVSSTDTQELVDLCDRVLVFRDGIVAAEITGDELTEGRLTREAFDVAAAPAVTDVGGDGVGG